MVNNIIFNIEEDIKSGGWKKFRGRRSDELDDASQKVARKNKFSLQVSDGRYMALCSLSAYALTAVGPLK